MLLEQDNRLLKAAYEQLVDDGDPDGYFSALISTNVLNPSDRENIRAKVREICEK
jgi:hypothetical protein